MDKKRLVLVPWSADWPKNFTRLKDVHLQHLGASVRIEHIGSTAVPGLDAKPILDIDIVVETEASVAGVIQTLSELGYHLWVTEEYLVGKPLNDSMKRFLIHVQSSLGRNIISTCAGRTVSASANFYCFRSRLPKKRSISIQHASFNSLHETRPCPVSYNTLSSTQVRIYLFLYRPDRHGGATALPFLYRVLNFEKVTV